MLDFTWKFFSKTGSIETYLLLKEMEKDVNDEMDQHEEELAHLDSNFLTRFVQTLMVTNMFQKLRASLSVRQITEKRTRLLQYSQENLVR